MRKLYRLFPIRKEGYLKVSDLHSIYFLESGNPKGKPVILIHGGPGSKSKPEHKKFFNPKKWRVIQFDHRGCGKSRPKGEIKENTTWDLVEDIEKLRKHLKIEKWIVYGGSWGSTLALAYSETYPKVVEKIILFSVWLCRKKDVDWLVNGDELKRLFPDLYEKREETLKKLKIAQNSISTGLHEKLFKGTKREQKLVSMILENWEGQFYGVGQRVKLINRGEVTAEMTLNDRILVHYLVNNCFFEENQLLNNVSEIKNIKTVIIHGRYDVVCPFEQAWELHKRLPNSILEIAPASGHHSNEPYMADRIVKYTDKFVS